MTKERKLVFSGVFTALGVLFPIAFHWAGASGPVFLPMHIPVLLAGLMLGWRSGLLVGGVTPVVSSLLTGMPPMWPILPVMIGELAMYGCASGYLYKERQISVWWTLGGALLAGRVAAVSMVAVLMTTMHLSMHPLTYIAGAIVTGVPGILIQLAFLPFLISRLERLGFTGKKEAMKDAG